MPPLLYIQPGCGAPRVGAASAGARAPRYAVVGLDDTWCAVDVEWASTGLQKKSIFREHLAFLLNRASRNLAVSFASISSPVNLKRST